jgi:hypothetical protein
MELSCCVMRRVVRFAASLFSVAALVPASVCALAGAQAAFAAGRGDGACHGHAIAELQRHSPHGYAIYQAMHDKNLFLTWMTCDDIQTELSTAVHESVHILTEEKDAYPLIDGGSLPRPHEVSHFFPPREIAGGLDADDAYVQNYLGPNGASSKSDFVYLLDELNAYSHDLETAIALVPLQRRDLQIDRRDGLAALMSFVMRYADKAERTQPATWRGLHDPEPRATIKALWSQAEKTLAASCGLPDFGMHDRDYIAYLCDKKNAGALDDLLGHAPACPAACLAPGTASSMPAR